MILRSKSLTAVLPRIRSNYLILISTATFQSGSHEWIHANFLPCMSSPDRAEHCGTRRVDAGVAGQKWQDSSSGSDDVSMTLWVLDQRVQGDVPQCELFPQTAACVARPAGQFLPNRPRAADAAPGTLCYSVRLHPPCPPGQRVCLLSVRSLSCCDTEWTLFLGRCFSGYVNTQQLNPLCSWLLEKRCIAQRDCPWNLSALLTPLPLPTLFISWP